MPRKGPKKRDIRQMFPSTELSISLGDADRSFYTNSFSHSQHLDFRLSASKGREHQGSSLIPIQKALDTQD